MQRRRHTRLVHLQDAAAPAAATAFVGAAVCRRPQHQRQARKAASQTEGEGAAGGGCAGVERRSGGEPPARQAAGDVQQVPLQGGCRGQSNRRSEAEVTGLNSRQAAGNIQQVPLQGEVASCNEKESDGGSILSVPSR